MVIFFPGSNLGTKSYLGKEGRNLAARKRGEDWPLCQDTRRTGKLLEDQSCTCSDGMLVPRKSSQFSDQSVSVTEQLLKHSINPGT